MFASLVIVDPHSVFCQVVRSLIEKRKDLGVMSEASDGHRASDKAREFRPDVIPTEILLPNRNGINLISRLSEADNRARVAAQSRREGRSEAEQAHAAVAAAQTRRVAACAATRRSPTTPSTRSAQAPGAGGGAAGALGPCGAPTGPVTGAGHQ